MLRLPIYTNEALETRGFYSTIEVSGEYYPVNEIVELVNESNQVRATALITNTVTTKFDHIGSRDLRNLANSHMRSWANAAEYFLTRFGSAFSYAGDVQLITFEVQSTMKLDGDLDTAITETQEAEVDLGIPSDQELGIHEEEHNEG